MERLAATLVILVQPVEFNDFYQSRGIRRTGGIATGLQTLGPSLVVGLLQRKQPTVSLTVSQKQRVVDIAVQRIVVGTEALAELIVVVVDLAPCPSVTLDAEMVVALARQLALPCPRLQHALRQRDAGRDAILQHLPDGYILVAVKVGLIGFVPGNSMREAWKKA